MAKRSYISPEDFLRYFRELAEDNKGDDLAEALLATFVIKRKSPGSISCCHRECEREVFYSDAVGWLKIPNLQQLNEKKQWKELFGEEMYFCSVEHALEEVKFLVELPY